MQSQLFYLDPHEDFIKAVVQVKQFSSYLLIWHRRMHLKLIKRGEELPLLLCQPCN